MLKKGMFAVAASSLLTSAAFAFPEVLTLDELRHRCHELESNGQILPFTSNFTCSEERTFWVKKGEQEILLPNSSEIRIRAQIKDGAHDCDWWGIDVPVHEQYGRCDILEQWKATARMTVTLRSCAELDEIANEQEFCKYRLQPVWDECDADRTQQQFGSSSSSSSSFQNHVGACEYIPTGLVKGCQGQPVPPHGPIPGSSSSSSTSSFSHHEVPAHSISSVSSSSDSGHGSFHGGEYPVSVTTTSSSSGQQFGGYPPVDGYPQGPIEPGYPQQGDQGYPQQDDYGYPQQGNYGYQLGADVRSVVVKKNFWKKHYPVVELQNNPAKGSMLSKCGFKKGDVISKVNGIRVKSGTDLQKSLAAAKKSGAALVKFRDSRGKFIEKTISGF